MFDDILTLRSHGILAGENVGHEAREGNTIGLKVYESLDGQIPYFRMQREPLATCRFTASNGSFTNRPIWILF